MANFLLVGVVAGALLFFFFVFSNSLTLMSPESVTPWRTITNILIYSAVGIFLICFAFLLSRLGD